MEIKRNADANWKGSLENGHGLISTHSHVLAEEKYSFGERTSDGSKGTNPEELISASVSSCFAMALSKTLGDHGHTAEKLRVRGETTLSLRDEGPKVTKITLIVEGLVPDISEDDFKKIVEETAGGCPLVQLLKPGLEELSITSSLVPPTTG
jgi:osmotically inducible protein OsmC